MLAKGSQIRRIRFQGSPLEVLNLAQDAADPNGSAADEQEADHGPPSKRRKVDDDPQRTTEYVTLSSELLEFIHVDVDEIPPVLTERDAKGAPKVEVSLVPAPRSRHVNPGKGKKDCRCHDCLRNRYDMTGGEVYVLRRPGLPELPISISEEDETQTTLRLCRLTSHVQRNIVWEFIQRPGSSTVLIRIQVQWQTSDLTSAFSTAWRRDQFLAYAIDTLLQGTADWGSSMMPKDLYGAAHIPPKSAANERSLQALTGMTCELLPFQNRAVHWLLEREHAALDNTSAIVSRPRAATMPVYFQEAKDFYGDTCYVSVLLGRVTKNKEFVMSHRDYLSGGILAEEMGLGKTVEIIALICLNKMKREESSTVSKMAISRAKATLIITPSALLSQWASELAIHAPHLSVMTYNGIKGMYSNEEVASLKSKLLNQDVVLMTYNTLSDEIHYANEVPDRQLRYEKKYELKRSPLIEILWHRVVLDEAQMVESTDSNVAKLAQLLPRHNAWAVTGTPVRKDMKDVHGLLAFLRYEPFSDKHIWDRLITSCRSAFRDVFSSICIRHTKGGVHDEIALPPQKRFVMTIPFTKVEQEHYQELFRQMCADCDVNEDGSPGVEDWDPEAPAMVAKMRSWLLRLRQACSHPDIGVFNRRAHGVTGGPLRTVEEVLEAMIEQNQKAIGTDERSFITTKLKQGLLLATLGKSQAALGIWTIAVTRSNEIVGEARKELGQISGTLQGSEKPSNTLFDAEAGADEESAAAEARKKATTALRYALELHHGSIFFSANAHYQMKDNVEITEPDSEQWKQLDKVENELYEEAKVIRRELLHEVAGKAQLQMTALTAKARAQAFVELPDLEELTARGGIEIRSILTRTETLIEGINAQSEVIDIWREQLIQLLLKPLLDTEAEGVELKGDEIDAAAKDQEQVFVYMSALRTIVADRAALITGEKNFLTDQEAKQMTTIAKEGQGPDPKKLLELFGIVDQLKTAVAQAGSLRAVVSELRSKTAALRDEAEDSRRAAVEKALTEACLKNLQAIVSSQLKTHTALDAELAMYRLTMNAKVEYYRQLQRLSDTVADFEDLKNPERQLKEIETKEPQLLQQIATKKSRARYLLNLRQESASTTAGERALCVICQCDFQTGALTICGHQFCKECIDAWWREHRSCPLCKKKLSRGDFHPITLKSRNLQARELGTDAAAQNGSGDSKSVSVYSGASSTMMDEIREIELHGSFGTKVNTISRHLLWIRRNAPGTKSVIFSLRGQFLRILMDAFKRFGIRFASLSEDKGAEKFRKDPAIECFLLDAAQRSSGLNLTTASNVFLCEPLINTAVELQAVARVHRIGQKQATSVWVYVTNGTVEESIFEIASSRRAKYLKSAKDSADTTERELEDLDTIEFQRKSIDDMLTKQGGESVDKEDLWACLFRKIDEGFRPDPAVDRDILRELQSRAIEIRHR